MRMEEKRASETDIHRKAAWREGWKQKGEDRLFPHRPRRKIGIRG